MEKANNTARELQKRVEHVERINIEIKTRLDETIQMYEQSQRDLRTKQGEVQRLNHELDKTREQKDQLARENKKMAGMYRDQSITVKIFKTQIKLPISLSFLDDLHDARNQMTEMNRRLHELELELRRLENEREELTAAYKEAEAVSTYSHRVTSSVLYIKNTPVNIVFFDL